MQKNLGIIAVIALIIIGAFMLVPKSEPTTDTSKENMNQSTDTVSVTKAVIETSKGKIELELYPDVAPKTVANFTEKAGSGYFNGLKFHRVEEWVIQGGDPLSRDESKKDFWGTGGGDIETELSDKPFVEGALGVARGNDIKISNDSQFFIVKNDSRFLDGQYTIFGKVLSGMEVVKQIAIGDQITAITVQ